MMEEAGIQYDTELVDPRATDRNDSEAFRTASLMGKVPAIIDEAVQMSESAAICVYVADVILGSSAVFMRMFDMWPTSRNLDAYADRCLERPAYARAMELSAG